MGDDAIKRIRTWLADQGYPLEMQTAAAFQRAGFSVQQSSYYRSAEGKEREIDVTASLGIRWPYMGKKHDGSLMFDLYVVCECKSGSRSKRPWLVFSSVSEGVGPGSVHLGTPLGVDALERFLDDDERLSIFRVPNRCGYAVASAHLNDSSNHDPAYGAVLALLDASRAKSDITLNDFVWLARITVPVLVVSTDLVECWLDAQGELQLEHRDAIQVLHHHPITDRNVATMFHVVHETHLPKFIARVEAAFECIRASHKHIIEDVLGQTIANPPDVAHRGQSGERRLTHGSLEMDRKRDGD